MLKDRRTYEIMMPEDVGLQRSELVLGKHSGRHALKARITELGYSIDDEQMTDRVRRVQKALRRQEGSLRFRYRSIGRSQRSPT